MNSISDLLNDVNDETIRDLIEAVNSGEDLDAVLRRIDTLTER